MVRNGPQTFVGQLFIFFYFMELVMSIRSRGFVAAMEDEVIEAPSSDEVPVELAEVTEIEAEAAPEIAAIEEIAEGVDSAMADSDTLENVSDQMADSLSDEGDGMSPETAEMAAVVTESICARLGINRRIMPSTESFGSTNSRRTATRVAMEGITDTLVRIWTAIKEAIKNFWNKIVAFFKRMFDGNRSLLKAAEALKIKVKAIRGSIRDGKSDFDDGSVCNAFRSNNSNVSSSHVKDILKNHSDLIGDAANGNTIQKKLEEVMTKAKSSIDTLKTDKKITNAGASDATEYHKSKEYYRGKTTEIIEIVKGIIGASATAPSATSNNYTLKSKNLYINGQSFEVEVEEEFNELEIDPASVANAKMKDSKDDEFRLKLDVVVEHTSASTKADVLSKTEMEKICDLVRDLAKSNSRVEDDVKKAEKANKTVLKEIEEVIDELESKEASGSGDNATYSGKILQHIARIVKKIITQSTMFLGQFYIKVASMNIQAGRAALSYVSKCVGKYSES